MTKKKYNFKTKSNFELLRYCASTFKKGWVCMGQTGRWYFSITKPKWDSIMWILGDKWDYLDYSVKLPKRHFQFAEHSLIRINGKGLAWFNENPDYVVSERNNYND